MTKSNFAVGKKPGRELEVGDLLFGVNGGDQITIIWEITEIQWRMSGTEHRNCVTRMVWSLHEYGDLINTEHRTVPIADNAEYVTEVPEIFTEKLLKDPR